VWNIFSRWECAKVDQREKDDDDDDDNETKLKEKPTKKWETTKKMK
jgi:hypothetical protein